MGGMRHYCVIALLLASTHASAGLYLQMPATYTAGDSISPAVRAECGLDTLYSGNVLEIMSRRVTDIQPTLDGSDVGNNAWLRLSIPEALGNPGGPMSGSKSVTVKAELVREGKVLASFDKSLTGGRGGILFRGTCDIMQKLTLGLAKHTGKWAVSAYAESQSAIAPDAANPEEPAGTAESAGK